MSEKIVLTGIKPTGTPHLGNYIGALKPLVDMSQKNHTFMFIADLHALNTMHDPKLIQQHTYELAASLVAMGLNLDNAILFRQSDIVEVYELSTLLTNVTPKGFRIGLRVVTILCCITLELVLHFLQLVDDTCLSRSVAWKVLVHQRRTEYYQLKEQGSYHEAP